MMMDNSAFHPIQVKAFIEHKNGLNYKNVGDRFALNPQAGRFAVADGVSGSYMPHLWSPILTESYVKLDTGLDASWFDEYTQERLNIDCATWQQRTEQLEDEADDYTAFLYSLSKEKYVHAASTLAGIKVQHALLHYDVLGDSCVFVIDSRQKEQPLSVFSTVNREQGFDNFPDYVTSDGKMRSKAVSGIVPLPQGYVMLMTDALSEWFLHHYASNPPIVERLWQLDNHEAFLAFLDEARANVEFPLHDDDYCLLMLRIEDPLQYDGYELLFIEQMADLVKAEQRDAEPIQAEEGQQETLQQLPLQQESYEMEESELEPAVEASFQKEEQYPDERHREEMMKQRPVGYAPYQPNGWSEDDDDYYGPFASLLHWIIYR